jgi:hypothetical protein
MSLVSLSLFKFLPRRKAMFDAGNDCDSRVSAFDPAEERPIRRQYTLKGVEADTIRLMRDAASKEGMKIGSWVSLRMKEAAEKALSKNRADASNSDPKELGPVSEVSSDLAAIMHHFSMVLDEQKQAAERRFLKVEKELHEITSIQRTILSALLTQRQSDQLPLEYREKFK